MIWCLVIFICLPVAVELLAGLALIAITIWDERTEETPRG